MTTDPNTLMARASCFRCIPRDARKEVMVYLMCQWSNNPTPVPPCGIPSSNLTLSGAGTAGVNQNYTKDSSTHWTGTNNAYTLQLVGGSWRVVFNGVTILYITQPGNFPCTWTGEPGLAPFPSGLYV